MSCWMSSGTSCSIAARSADSRQTPPSSASQPRSRRCSTSLTMKRGFPSVCAWTTAATSSSTVAAAETILQVCRHVAPAQVLERDLPALTVRAQRRHDLGERVVEHRRLRRPIGAQEHDSRPLGPLREHRDEIHRALVAPVQVLQDQHQRAIDRDRLHQARELTQHAVGRRVGVPAPRAAPRRRASEARASAPASSGRRRAAWRAAGRGPVRGSAAPGPPGPACRAPARRAAPRTGHSRSGRRRPTPAARRRKASTIEVLPMPGSPCMNTTWRSPADAVWKMARSVASSVSRPTRVAGIPLPGRAGARPPTEPRSPAGVPCTRAMKRTPRR